jgi:hypothetical protein
MMAPKVISAGFSSTGEFIPRDCSVRRRFQFMGPRIPGLGIPASDLSEAAEPARPLRAPRAPPSERISSFIDPRLQPVSAH